MEEIRIFWILHGEEIRNFGPNIYLCYSKTRPDLLRQKWPTMMKLGPSASLVGTLTRWHSRILSHRRSKISFFIKVWGNPKIWGYFWCGAKYGLFGWGEFKGPSLRKFSENCQKMMKLRTIYSFNSYTFFIRTRYFALKLGVLNVSWPTSLKCS